MKSNGGTRARTAAATWNLKNLSSSAGPSGRSWSAFRGPAELSRELRGGTGDFLKQRRTVVILSLAAMGAMSLISLYQMGIVKHLPGPPLPRLDSDRVDGSPSAYERLSTPDAALGTASYAATLVLAAMGGAQRARLQPWIPLALTGKLGFDVFQTIRMVRTQWTKYKAFCFWCLLAGGATLASVPLLFGETRAALRSVAKT
jgi:uncharacterized membrane protein